MSRTSCIQHPPSMAIVMIRQDYVAICCDAPDPHCAAAILNNMEFLTNVKLANHRQVEIENEIAVSEGIEPIPDNGIWIYKSHEDTQADLMDVFGRNKIVNNSTWLVEKGFIDTRSNPRFKWDKTKQYSLNIDAVQDAISNLPSFKNKRSKRAKSNDGASKSKRAIPETTTETTTEEHLPNGDVNAVLVAKHIPEYLIPVFHSVREHVFGLLDTTVLDDKNVRYMRAIAQVARTKAGKDCDPIDIAARVKGYADYCKGKGYTPSQSKDKFSLGFMKYLQVKSTHIPAPIPAPYEGDDAITIPDNLFETLLKKG